MKINNHESINGKESRLAKALVLASSHEGCSTAAIEHNEVNTWGAIDIFDVVLVFDILGTATSEVFRVLNPDCLTAPSAEAANTIANQVNSVLAVAKVVVQDNRLIILAHEFIAKDGIPIERNLKCMIDNVLVGIVLVLKAIKEHKNTSALLKNLPACPEPVLN